MSEALVCDVCGHVAGRHVAPRHGWIAVRALAELSQVVAEDHPLHHTRHLCSTECYSTFSAAVTAGRSLAAPSPPQDGRAAAVAAGHTAVPPSSEGQPDAEPEVQGARPPVTATPSPPEREPAPGRAPARLSRIIDVANADVDEVDLRRIAEKPAPRRRSS